MIRREYVLAGLAAAGLAASAYEIRRLRNELAEAPGKPGEKRLSASALLAGVELGGTSVRVGVCFADAPAALVDATEIATGDPETTLRAIVAFLDRHAPFAALGVAAFGPVVLDPAAPRYGWVANTPKPRWRHFNILRHFARYRVPVGFDTDVNAPALAELRYGGHDTGTDAVAFMTVGTGVGVGLVLNGAPVHGLQHPEGGHVLAARHAGDEHWAPGKCVEDLCGADAIAARIGVDQERLHTVSDEHPAWDSVAFYLAQLCLSVTYMVSPHVIVLSGGVMKRAVLFPKIRAHFKEMNNGYITHPRVSEQLDRYIVPSAFGNDIGIIGALELARRAALGISRPSLQ